MRVTSPLFAFISRALAAYASADQNDAVLTVPPILMNTGSLPLPAQTFFSSSSASVRNVTHHGIFQATLTASNTFTMTTLGEGVWDVDWHHYLEVSGAVADITSVSDLLMVITGMTGSPIAISRIRGTNVEQGRSGSIRLTVLKDQPILFQSATVGGAGTSTSLARFSLFCSKIL